MAEECPEMVSIGIYVPAEFLRRAEKLAAQQERKRGDVIRRALRVGLEAAEKNERPVAPPAQPGAAEAGGEPV